MRLCTSLLSRSPGSADLFSSPSHRSASSTQLLPLALPLSPAHAPRCPNCGEYTISAKGKGSAVDDVDVTIRPKSIAYKFPDYIPQAIRSDYEEACSIVNLSPKASATLSRRCLQGMIRDFFQVSKANLFEEINAIKDKIPTEQWAVLDGLRRIGNIGAHMERDINLIVDIEPGEAQKLIKLIELLLQQWYIERHNQQELYADIIGIDQAKQQERKKTE